MKSSEFLTNLVRFGKRKANCFAIFKKIERLENFSFSQCLFRIFFHPDGFHEKAARADGGAAALCRAGSRAEGHRRHHPARPRSPAPRGRAAPRCGAVAFGARRLTCARCGPRRL